MTKDTLCKVGTFMTKDTLCKVGIVQLLALTLLHPKIVDETKIR